MRIDSSTISMASTRTFKSTATEDVTNVRRYYGSGGVEKATAYTTTSEISKLEVQGGTSVFSSSSGGIVRTDKNQVSHRHGESKQLGGRGSGSGAANADLANLAATGNDHWISNYINYDIDNNPQIQALKRMLELLEKATGKRSFNPLSGLSGFKQASRAAASFNFGFSSVKLSSAALALKTQGSAAAQGTVSANGYWTHQTVVSGFVKGEEHTAFSSVGSVVTSDGRTISFGMTMEMSRSFAAAYEVEGVEAVFTDPLVINLDTDAAELSDVTFYFDLDCDGAEDELSALDSGSGLLALDKNGDGQINDGSELFGAKTGDGFGELAQYDSDGNGWIDEADDVFSKLKVWVRCGSGEPELLSLSKAGVGAIFLGSQSTLHTLADPSGKEAAMVRSTGVFLKENGQVGTIQHIDFKA